jgi:hypothetical protein
VDAARVTTATVVGTRSRRGLGTDSLAWRLGASHDLDLLTRLTRSSVPEMKRRVALGEKVAPRMLGGAVLEPVFPVVAAALAAGELGIDSAENIVKALAEYTVHGRFDTDPARLDRAETALVEQATGACYGRRSGQPDPDPAGTGAAGVDPVRRLGDAGGFTFPADGIRQMGPAWQAYLNPDGIAPNEEIVEAKSTFSFGALRDGLYPLRGGVTADLKGVIQNLFTTFLSARSAPAFPSAEEQDRLDAGAPAARNAPTFSAASSPRSPKTPAPPPWAACHPP